MYRVPGDYIFFSHEHAVVNICQKLMNVYIVLFPLAEVLKDLWDQNIVYYDRKYNRTETLTMGQIFIFLLLKANLFEIKKHRN